MLVLVLPDPDSVDELFAAQVMPALFFFLQQPLFDDGLRGDTGMVGARHPQGVVPLHPLEANEDVLQRVVQRVPQVQGPGNVRWRNDNRVRLARGIGLAMKISPFLPKRIPPPLRLGMMVLGGQVGRECDDRHESVESRQ